jgi:hypothetical protein
MPKSVEYISRTDYDNEVNDEGFIAIYVDKTIGKSIKIMTDI